MAGTTFETNFTVTRGGDDFVINGLVDHELADVFSTISSRLAPTLGFSDDHPSLVNKTDGQGAYGSLLEMVESELSIPLSRSQDRPRIGKNTRGMLAPAEEPKSRKRKRINPNQLVLGLQA